MKILIIGAGPLGSLFAARLVEAGQNVSLLARGQRHAEILQHGIVLEDFKTGARSTTQISLVERLEPQEMYDLAMVIMRKNLALQLLPTLAANQSIPSILFLMNNAAGPQALVNALGQERVLVGFPMSAGYRDGYVIHCLAGSEERKISIPIGEVDGSITPRTLLVADVLKSMRGYDVQIRTDMDAWLKTHAALLMPSLAAALYASGTDRVRMARTRDALVLAIRAVREGFQVLRALGIPIVPKELRWFEWIPEPLLVPYLRKLMLRPEMEAAMVGHANAARDEILHLTGEFLELARTAGTPTPAIERLLPYLDPQTPRLADGSAEIALDWRGIWIGAAALASLVGAGVYGWNRYSGRKR